MFQLFQGLPQGLSSLSLDSRADEPAHFECLVATENKEKQERGGLPTENWLRTYSAAYRHWWEKELRTPHKEALHL